VLNSEEYVRDYKIKANDCFVQLHGREPKEVELAWIVALLPQDILDEALRWGWTDTVVGDSLYCELRDNPKKYEYKGGDE
jgi:hypothetical protein